MTLEEEADRLNLLLAGKTVSRVFRHRPGEFGIEFTDYTRLFVDRAVDGVSCSVTGGEPEAGEQP